MKDLSHLCGDTGNALIGGESSSGSNTINHPVTSVGAAPGSMPVNLPAGGDANHMDSPALEVPKSPTKHQGAQHTNAPESTTPTWKKV